MSRWGNRWGGRWGGRWGSTGGATPVIAAYLSDFLRVGAIGRFITSTSRARFVRVAAQGRFPRAKQLDRGTS